LSARKRIEYQADPNKFDLQVHAWDGQGQLVKANHYRQFIIGGITYYERPVNSGNLWFENNQPAGRMEYELGDSGKIGKKTLNKEAEHLVFTKPLSGAEKVHFELEKARERNAQLEAEIAAIKVESEARKVVQNVAPQVSTQATQSAPTLTKKAQANG